MSLRFKRNLPIILLLIAMLSFLAFAMGDQPIVAYTVKVGSPQTGQVTIMRFDAASDFVLPVGLQISPTLNYR